MQPSQQLNKSNIFYRISSKQRLIAFVVFWTIVGVWALLLLAGQGKIDPGFWFGRCGFKQRYSLPCPTCGITTSAMTFANGKIFQAFLIQPAGALLCFIMAFLGFLALFMAVFGVNFRFLKRFLGKIKAKYVFIAIILIILASWALTLFQAIIENK